MFPRFLNAALVESKAESPDMRQSQVGVGVKWHEQQLHPKVAAAAGLRRHTVDPQLTWPGKETSSTNTFHWAWPSLAAAHYVCVWGFCGCLEFGRSGFWSLKGSVQHRVTYIKVCAKFL